MLTWAQKQGAGRHNRSPEEACNSSWRGYGVFRRFYLDWELQNEAASESKVHDINRQMTGFPGKGVTGIPSFSQCQKFGSRLWEEKERGSSSGVGKPLRHLWRDTVKTGGPGRRNLGLRCCSKVLGSLKAKTAHGESCVRREWSSMVFSPGFLIG